MFSRTVFLVLLFLATNVFALDRQERVIAGGPADSLEVRHLILTGTNEEIGRALAEIARDRYGVRPEPSRDRLRTRASRRYIEKNYPILRDRLRGVAAAFGGSLDDDGVEYSGLPYTDLRAGCSIVHLPPESTTSKSSVVSRDYDYSTGNINFGFLEPGMLHPTARPYLIELHPDRGYPSIAMVSYELLSGVLDGMNSEGLVVTIAMDDEIFASKQIEPTYGPAAGLGVLQMLRLLLDTAANVEEAKEILLQTKQYYEYIPCHFLIADRHGKSFVWEYSALHNKEYIIENPGKPLVMTNFTLHKYMDGDHPPSAERAKGVCRRYSHLAEHLASGPVSDELLRNTHGAVDAQAPARPDAKRPPIRTFWHALYYPEERRVKFSYYLGDRPGGGIRRTEYIEFKLTPTTAPPAKPIEQQSKPPAPMPNKSDEMTLEKVPDAASLLPSLATKHPDLRVLQLMGTNVTDADLIHLRGLTKLEGLGLRATAVTGSGLTQLASLRRLGYVNLADTKLTDAEMPALGKLPGLTGLNLSNTKVTDAGLIHLKSMARLTKLNLTGTPVTDAGITEAKKWLPFWAKITR
jgi:hypothetical protein